MTAPVPPASGDAPAVSAEGRRLIEAHQGACIAYGGYLCSINTADMAVQHAALSPYVAGLEADLDDLAEALWKIAKWADAYPTDVFPEPDAAYYAKAHEVLAANGMALDRLSAAAMRRVVKGVGEIAKATLAAQEKPRDDR